MSLNPMDALISPEYVEQLQELHKTRDDFGRSSPIWAQYVVEMSAALGSTDILDYGCGKGELSLHLPWDITRYDPAIPAFSMAPRPHDFLVCTDVLEHIEPDKLSAVLAHIKVCTKRVALLHIATRPAVKKLADGRNAHLLVMAPDWWKDEIVNAGFLILDSHVYGEDAQQAAVNYLVYPEGLKGGLPEQVLGVEFPL